MVGALLDLRTIQLAHQLIPWKELDNEIWAHHRIAFIGAIFDFVMKVDTRLPKTRGITLEDLPKRRSGIRGHRRQIWQALTSSK